MQSGCQEEIILANEEICRQGNGRQSETPAQVEKLCVFAGCILSNFVLYWHWCHRYPAFGGSPSGDCFLSPDLTKGGLLMYITYSDMIQIGILVVGICSLVVQICKKK